MAQKKGGLKRPRTPNGASAEKPRENPFEMRFSRQKHAVVGRSIRGARGNPGIARARANEIRTQTLLQEWKQGARKSTLVDRRIGERDDEMTVDEKMLRRFAAEKAQRVRQRGSGVFSLGGASDELTHYGQSLSEVQAMGRDDLQLFGDDEDDHGPAGIDRDTVARTHFGGFDEPVRDDDAPRSRCEIMHEVMAKSKLFKYERQKMRAENDELRRAMDDDLDAVRGLLRERERTQRPAEAPAEKPDAYERALRELVFDRRSRPTDHMPTEADLLRREAERLEHAEDVPGAIPHVLPCPATADDLQSLLDPWVRGADAAAARAAAMTALGRIRVLYHPKLAAANVAKYERLASSLWTAVSETALGSVAATSILELDTRFALVDVYVQHLADIAGINPAAVGMLAHNALCEIEQRPQGHPAESEDKDMSNLVAIQLCAYLFPAPGQGEVHLVWTHMQLVLAELQARAHNRMLQTARRAAAEASVGPQLRAEAVLAVQLVQLQLEIQREARQFVPETGTLVNTLVALVAPADAQLPALGLLPAPARVAGDAALVPCGFTGDEIKAWPVESVLLGPQAVASLALDSFCGGLLHAVASAVEEVARVCGDPLVAIAGAFDDTHALLQCTDAWPARLLEARKTTAKVISGAALRRRALQMQKFKAIPIAAYAPKFDAEYSLDRRPRAGAAAAGSAGAAERRERDRLKAQVKREHQGAIRELRKDTAFLHRAQISKTRERDAAYRSRIAQIVGQLGDQEGEGKKHDRARARAQRARKAG